VGPERGTTVLAGLLADLGFEPGVATDGLVQRNCPFRRLAERSPEVICGLNRRLVEGMLDGLGASRLTAALSPADDRCCVVVASG
jgi:predicted ArsR family transcriptional regulator